MGDDRDVFEKMIELQIKAFNELSALRKEYSTLQTAYRVQCVMNARLMEQLKRINEFVLGNRYLVREDLMAMLGLDEEPSETADDLPLSEEMGDALSRETEEMAG